MRSVSFISLVVLQGRIYNTGYFDIALAEMTLVKTLEKHKPSSIPHHSQKLPHSLMHVVALQTLLYT